MNGDLYKPLLTERTGLRCPRHEDAKTIVQLMTYDVSRWLAAWPAPLAEQMAAAKIAAAHTDISEGHALHFLVERLENKEIMGWIRVSRTENQAGVGDLGYWFGAAYHHCGYATEAIAEAIAAAFERLELDLIEGGAQPENTASFAVMRRIGMNPCGDRIVWADTRKRAELCHFYAVSRDEFALHHRFYSNKTAYR